MNNCLACVLNETCEEHDVTFVCRNCNSVLGFNRHKLMFTCFGQHPVYVCPKCWHTNETSIKEFNKTTKWTRKSG